MKRLHTALAQAVALVAFASASGFAAAASQPIAVSATVLGVCKFGSGTTTTMSFGEIDPSVGSTGSAKTATTAIAFQCTKSLTAPTFSVGGSTSGTTAPGLKMTSAGGDLPYSVTWTNPTAAGAAGFGAADIAVTLTGTVATTDYIAAPAGAYTATLNVIVTP